MSLASRSHRKLSQSLHLLPQSFGSSPLPLSCGRLLLDPSNILK